MSSYEIVNRSVFDESGPGESRREVQVVRPEDGGEHVLRVCYYQENGRFGYAPPTLTAEEDVIEEFHEALDEMSDKCREANLKSRVKEIVDQADDIGEDYASAILNEASRLGPEKAIDLLSDQEDAKASN